MSETEARYVLERLLGLHLQRALRVAADLSIPSVKLAIQYATLMDSSLGEQSLFHLYESYVHSELDSLAENKTWITAMRGDCEKQVVFPAPDWTRVDEDFTAAWVRGDPFVRLVHQSLNKLIAASSKENDPGGPANP